MKRTGASASTLLVKRLAADALLQQRERRRPRSCFQTTISPSSTLPSGSARGRAGDLRKALGDQLFAARPDPHWPARRLTICARMPSYFHSTSQCAGAPMPALEVLCGRRRSGAQGRTGTAGRRRAGAAPRRRRDQRGKARRVGHRLGVGVAHHACATSLASSPACCSARAAPAAADADPKAAADQLAEQKAAGAVELVPHRGEPRRLLAGRQAAQRQQPLLDPRRERRRRSARAAAAAPARSSRRGRRPPDSTPRTAIRRCRRGDRGGAQQRRRHRLARPAAGQEVGRPGGVGGRRAGVVAQQRVELGRGGGARVELGVQRSRNGASAARRDGSNDRRGSAARATRRAPS